VFLLQRSKNATAASNLELEVEHPMICQLQRIYPSRRLLVEAKGIVNFDWFLFSFNNIYHANTLFAGPLNIGTFTLSGS
jgi:hypothetical protein